MKKVMFELRCEVCRGLIKQERAGEGGDHAQRYRCEGTEHSGTTAGYEAGGLTT